MALPPAEFVEVPSEVFVKGVSRFIGKKGFRSRAYGSETRLNRHYGFNGRKVVATVVDRPNEIKFFLRVGR